MKDYEGILNPTPIKIELRGQLPLFDVDKELNFDFPTILNPTPIKIELRGQLPLFDVDKELNFDFPTMIPTIYELEKEKKQLLDNIPDANIFRKHIPKQVELEKFINALKEKIIHEYDIPITVKELRAG